MRVLIVEDDAALGAFLQRGLKSEGHEVELVADGQAGLTHCLAHRPELMVLDLSLPGMDGMQVLEEMRGRFAGTSVLVLTGRTGLEDRVRCLNLGADDFLPKPFSLSELMARCRALMRRREHFRDPMLRFGSLELDRMRRSASRDGQVVDLTGKEFALLEYLMQAHGRICSRAELLREVWQMTPDAGTNVVDVYVNYLRKKLNAVQVAGWDSTGGGGSEKVIETVRGEGYVMAVTDTMRRPVGRVTGESVRATLVGPAWGLARA